MLSSLLFQQLDNIQNNFDLQPLLELEKLKAFGIEYDRDVLADLKKQIERKMGIMKFEILLIEAKF